MKRKILHLLQWKLNDITEHLSLIKEQGFTAVQTSPLQGTKDDGYEWWKLYQPINYKIGNYQIGTKDDLIHLCEEAHRLDIEIYVDIALRNVASSENDGTKPHELVDKDILKYVKDVEDCKNYDDRYECTMKRIGLPFVDYTNEAVQAMHIAYLYDLIACEVDGFRIDMLKHFSLPEEGCNYLKNVYKHFSDLYIYGEVLFAPTWLLDKYAQYVDVLTDCRLTDETKSVLFFESHDSFLSLGLTTNLSYDQMIERWNQLVNHTNANCIFYARSIDNDLHNAWLSKDVKKINGK